jgi:dTDP-glucose pyrophosphorylase
MRICIDIDGTVCEYRSPTGDYASTLPLPHAAAFIRARKEEGHTIILHTARQGETLLRWLAEHGVPYDELVFGKPYADIYIDDNALRFEGNWKALEDSGAWNRPSTEKAGKINVVVTMAGAGARFARAGYDLPKPLIPVFGEPMYRHAVRSLPLHLAGRLIFVIRRDGRSDAMRADIEETFGAYDPRVVVIDRLTRGQAETLLYAELELAFHYPVLVHNADSAYAGGDFEGVYRKADGALMTFDSDEDRWSYAGVGADGRVTEVREKVPISRHASTGTYFFRSSTQLLRLVRDAIAAGETEKGEFYIGPLYNKMIAAGQTIVSVPVERFVSFGTPEDLAKAEAEGFRLGSS